MFERFFFLTTRTVMSLRRAGYSFMTLLFSISILVLVIGCTEATSAPIREGQWIKINLQRQMQDIGPIKPVLKGQQQPTSPPQEWVLEVKQLETDLARSKSDQPGRWRILQELGVKYLERANDVTQFDSRSNRKALDYLNQAMKIAYKIGEPALIGQSLATLGIAYSSLGDKEKAIKLLNEAAPILQSNKELIDGTVVVGAMSLLCGLHVADRGNQRSLDVCYQTLELNKELNVKDLNSSILKSIGIAHLYEGKYQMALIFFTSALALTRELNDKEEEAWALTATGLIYDRWGQWDKAIDYYEKSRSSVNDLFLSSISLVNEASIYSRRGNIPIADELLETALEAASKLSLNKACIFCHIGLRANATTEIYRAIRYLEAALLEAKKIDDAYSEAAIRISLGSVYLSLGDLQKAKDHITQSLPVYERLHNFRGKAAALHMLGGFHAASGDRKQAIIFLTESLQLHRFLRERNEEAYDLISLGEIEETSEGKINLYRQALDLLEEIGNRVGRAKVLYNIGLAYSELGKEKEALENFSSALLEAEAVSDRRRIGVTLSNIASIYLQQGRFNEALEHYQRSIDTEEAIRTDARLDEFRVKLAELSLATYHQAFKLNIKLGREAQAFAITERARARAFLDQLGNSRSNLLKDADPKSALQIEHIQSEIADLGRQLGQERARPLSLPSQENASSISEKLIIKQKEYADLLTHLKLTKPESASLISVATSTLPEIQKLLDPKTTLVSYYITPDTTHAFVLSQSSLRVIDLKVSENDLRSAVGWLRQFGDLDQLPVSNLKKLYDQLITPIEKYLLTEKLGVIPHGILHYLSFAALSDGKHYFGDKYQLFYLPSASSLAYLQQKRKPHGSRLLAAAQPQAEGFPILHNAEQEVRSVAALYQTRPLLGAAATESRIRALARNYNLIFLAAHGELMPDNPLFSRIVLASDRENKGEETDGFLTVREIYGLDLARTELVVLSACDTQLGERSRGDDIVALNRAFISAGSPSVIASLWKVDDQATHVLMKRFYHHLKIGQSKAEALQAAQRETRLKYPHPYYWAAFVLTGDPGAKTSRSPIRRR